MQLLKFALRAIEIDPALAQSHALLGMFRTELDYNWPGGPAGNGLNIGTGPLISFCPFPLCCQRVAAPWPDGGEIDEAFTGMDRAIDERDSIIVPIKTYPFLDPLRTDPRFKALLRKMKLA
jgi:hypothetical protein